MFVRSPPGGLTARRLGFLASVSTVARSSFVLAASSEPKAIDAERSNQRQSVCAASHSRSRTNAWFSRADRRQSTRAAGSPDTNGRNCQNVSPGPACLRPWTPCITLCAIRRAATTRLGRRAASVAACSRRRDEGAGAVAIASGHVFRDETPDHSGDRFAFGPRRERQRHPVLQNGFGQRRDILARGREPAIDDRPCATR